MTDDRRYSFPTLYHCVLSTVSVALAWCLLGHLFKDGAMPGAVNTAGGLASLGVATLWGVWIGRAYSVRPKAATDSAVPKIRTLPICFANTAIAVMILLVAASIRITYPELFKTALFVVAVALWCLFAVLTLVVTWVNYFATRPSRHSEGH